MRRSAGAILFDRLRGVVRVPTITPAKRKDGACVFLTADDRCEIHDVAPAGCALFDTHMSQRESQRRSLWLHRGILADPNYEKLRSTLDPHEEAK